MGERFVSSQRAALGEGHTTDPKATVQPALKAHLLKRGDCLRHRIQKRILVKQIPSWIPAHRTSLCGIAFGAARGCSGQREIPSRGAIGRIPSGGSGRLQERMRSRLERGKCGIVCAYLAQDGKGLHKSATTCVDLACGADETGREGEEGLPGASQQWHLSHQEWLTLQRRRVWSDS